MHGAGAVTPSPLSYAMRDTARYTRAVHGLLVTPSPRARPRRDGAPSAERRCAGRRLRGAAQRARPARRRARGVVVQGAAGADAGAAAAAEG
eukprot:scaffold81287_cov72-Phaeocystis_antarctica.AAC.9